MAKLASDPEWLEAREADDYERLERMDSYDRDAAGVKADLAAAGFETDSLDDLRHQSVDYRAAIPVLIGWLPRVENQDVKESIVRNLTVVWAKPDAARPLVEEFRRARDQSGTGLRWAIGNALAEVADDSVFSEVAELAANPEWGRSREMLAVALGNMSDPRTVDVLRALLADEEVAGHAVIALGKLQRSETRVDVEPFLTHPKAWVREEARNAIGQIDGQ